MLAATHAPENRGTAQEGKAPRVRCQGTASVPVRATGKQRPPHCAMRRGSRVLLFLALVAASGCHRTEAEALRAENASLMSALAVARQDIRSQKAKVAQLRGEVAKLEAVLDEHAAGEHGRLDKILALVRQSKLREAIQEATSFETHFPGSKLLGSVVRAKRRAVGELQARSLESARERLDARDFAAALSLLAAFASEWGAKPHRRKRQLLRKRALRLKSEAERVEKMATVTIEEISVAPGAYKGMALKRDVVCRKPEITNYVHRTGIAEITVRAGRGHSAECYVRFEHHPEPNMYIWDPDTAIGVRMNARLAKRIILEFPSRAKYGGTVYRFAGVFRFGGQISMGIPVMHLTAILDRQPTSGPAPP